MLANAERLEAVKGTVAVGHCAPDAIPETLGYGPLSREVAVRMTRHLVDTPRWRGRRRFESPYGCLYLYEWTAVDAPAEGRRRDVRKLTGGP